MNHKIILLSVVTASMLFTGCGSSDGFTAERVEPTPIPVKDTTAPIITLNGNTKITLNVGDTYTEQGAKTDDGSSIRTSETVVDTSKVGTYTITYNSVDKAGNQATEVKRIVRVQEEDTTPPVITLNGESEITLKIENTYTEQGAKTDDGSTITTSGTVDTSKVGTYTITYNSVDASGNKATELKRTVTIVDLITPIITLNGTSTITLNLGDTYTEQGAKIDDDSTVTISGDVVDTSKVGTYIITYNSVDDAENKAIEVIRTVIVEEKIYTISGYAIDGPIKDARVYLDANDNGAYDENETNTTTNTVGYYEFKSKTDARYDIAIIVDGGIDTVTGKAFEGVLKKRYQKGDNLESLMVTPASTLVDTFVKKDKMTLKDARKKVANFLNISEEEIIKNPTKDIKLYKVNLMLIKYAEFLDNGFEELAEDIKDTEKTIETFSNDKTYILDEIFRVLRKLTFIPKAGEGNGEIDDMPMPEPLDPQVVVDEIKDSLNILDKNSALDNVTTDLNLKTFLTTHRAIDLSFTTESDAINIETGKVTRPAFGQEDINTTIIATIKKGDVAEITKDFEVTIKAFAYEPIPPEEALKIAEKLITFDKIKGDNISESLIEHDLKLPAGFEHGVVATYSSTNSAINEIGSVTQPSSNSQDAIVEFTILLTVANLESTTTYDLIVPSGKLTDQEMVEKAIGILDLRLEDYNLNHNLRGQLPTSESLNVNDILGVIVTYSSDYPNNLTSDGMIIQPLLGARDLDDINITATISKNDATILKYFNATIPALSDYQEAIDDARDSTTFNSFKGENISENNITTKLSLPISHTFNTNVDVILTWSSSNEDVIPTKGDILSNGMVTQTDKEETVTLTVAFSTIEDGTYDISDEKDPIEFILTVPAKGGDILAKAKEALDFDDIKNANSDAENVTSNLEMITSLTGFEGVVIEWESDNSAIDASTGEVTQPEGDGKVTPEPIDIILTATLSKNGEESVSKPINVTVLPVEDGGKK